MSAPLLRPRSIGEILDLSFQILRGHFREMALAMLVLVSPILALRLVLPVGAGVFIELLANFVYMAAGAAAVVLTSEVYLGRKPDVRAALGAAGRRFLSVWGATIIQGFLVFLGFLLLVVPAFIFGAWAFAMVAAVMIENRTAGDSFTRSRALARGYVMRILGVMLVAWIIFFAGVMGAGFALGLAMEALPGAERIFLALADAVSALFYLFIPAAGTVLYYDLRIRKEAFDVEVAAEQIQPAPPSAAEAAL